MSNQSLEHPCNNVTEIIKSLDIIVYLNFKHLIYTSCIIYPKLKINVHMLACTMSVHVSKLFIIFVWFTSLILTVIPLNSDILGFVVYVRI